MSPVRVGMVRLTTVAQESHRPPLRNIVTMPERRLTTTTFVIEATHQTDTCPGPKIITDTLRATHPCIRLGQLASPKPELISLITTATGTTSMCMKHIPIPRQHPACVVQLVG